MSAYMHHCRNCKSPQQFLRPETSHVLHLLLSIITIGLWLPVWFLIAANHSTSSQCTRCGQSSGLAWGHLAFALFVALVALVYYAAQSANTTSTTVVKTAAAPIGAKA